MFIDKNYQQKMQKTLDIFSKDLGSLRTGRANVNMQNQRGQSYVHLEFWGGESRTPWPGVGQSSG